MTHSNHSLLTRFLHGIPSFLWLTFVWCAAWRDFGLPSVAFGAILALLVLLVFRLPTLYLSNRFNIWYALVFLGYFTYQVARASVEVFWFALTYKAPLRNSVVAVKLRTESDLWITAISHAMSLIPGSLVVDVDRGNSILYFHVLNASDQDDVEEFRAEAHRIEAMILKAVGSKEEFAMITADESRSKTAKGSHRA